MALLPIQLQHAAALLHELLAGGRAADKTIEAYFRAHPKLGARDRGAVAELAYSCLRRRRSLEYTSGSVSAPDLVATYLLTHEGHSARAVGELAGRDVTGLTTRVRTTPLAAAPWAVRADLPDWLATALCAQWGEDRALALAQALNRPAPVDLRVNPLKADRETVRARLAAEGFASEPTPYSPLGLRRHDRAPLFRTQSFHDGLFEIQDEGSQLLAYLLEPKRQERIVDFCAGAGGKTLHIGALLANTGTVYAFDIAQKRLDKLKPRLIRAGLDNVRVERIASENDARVQRLRGKIDRVLVDAPCSGTGTVRRNPDIKWRSIDLAELAATQGRILHAAAALAKPGGRVVYATCSLVEAENEAVVAQFLATHADFELVPAAEILGRRHIALADAGTMLRLDPVQHGTDAFFAAALQRRG